MIFLLLLFALACEVEILSGPWQVALDEAAVFELGLSANGVDGESIWVVADVPVGWELTSAVFEGVANGQPLSDDGTLVERDACFGEVREGFQRLTIEVGPLVEDLETSGIATVAFHVTDQPAGPYTIFFYFGGDGASSIRCSPPSARTINQTGNAFLTYVTSIFDAGQTERGSDPGEPPRLMGPSVMAVTADGGQLLVGADTDATINVFDRVDVTGDLLIRSAATDGLDGVDGIEGLSDLVLSPDEAHVFAAGSGEDAITIFERSTVTGDLTFLAAVTEDTSAATALAGVSALAISPDGHHLYAAATSDQALVVFEVSKSGLLHLVEEIVDADTPAFLSQPEKISLSPDGNHLYVLGDGSEAIAIFERHAVDGALTFLANVEAVTVGVGGFDDLLVAPGGSAVYVAGSELLHFARDAATGLLSLVQELPNGFAGEEEPSIEAGRRSIAMSPDGSWVYSVDVASLTVFRRDSISGVLTFDSQHVEGDGRPANRGLGRVGDLVPSADGRDLYVADRQSNSIATFGVEWLFSDGFEAGDLVRWSSNEF